MNLSILHINSSIHTTNGIFSFILNLAGPLMLKLIISLQIWHSWSSLWNKRSTPA